MNKDDKRLIDVDATKHSIDVVLATAINRGVSNIPMGKDSSSAFEFLRGYERGALDVTKIVLGQKTVDAVEVVHGRWVLHQEDGYEWYECSSCRAQPLNDNAERPVLSDYCPDCGAKMDGGNENA